MVASYRGFVGVIHGSGIPQFRLFATLEFEARVCYCDKATVGVESTNNQTERNEMVMLWPPRELSVELCAFNYCTYYSGAIRIKRIGTASDVPIRLILIAPE